MYVSPHVHHIDIGTASQFLSSRKSDIRRSYCIRLDFRTLIHQIQSVLELLDKAHEF